jgi:hypothetical protein
MYAARQLGKKTLSTVAAAYFTIGVLLGIILGGSYVVAAILFCANSQPR